MGFVDQVMYNRVTHHAKRLARALGDLEPTCFVMLRLDYLLNLG